VFSREALGAFIRKIVFVCHDHSLFALLAMSFAHESLCHSHFAVIGLFYRAQANQKHKRKGMM